MADFSRKEIIRLKATSHGFVNLTGVDLAGVDLSALDLQGVVFINANLVGVNLSKANLSASNLEGANLSNSILSGINLTNSNLKFANMSEAVFCDTLTHLNTQLIRTCFEMANLKKANLQNVYMDEVDCLSIRSLD